MNMQIPTKASIWLECPQCRCYTVPHLSCTCGFQAGTLQEGIRQLPLWVVVAWLLYGALIGAGVVLLVMAVL